MLPFKIITWQGLLAASPCWVWGMGHLLLRDQGTWWAESTRNTELELRAVISGRTGEIRTSDPCSSIPFFTLSQDASDIWLVASCSGSCNSLLAHLTLNLERYHSAWPSTLERMLTLATYFHLEDRVIPGLINMVDSWGDPWDKLDRYFGNGDS